MLDFLLLPTTFEGLILNLTTLLLYSPSCSSTPDVKIKSDTEKRKTHQIFTKRDQWRYKFLRGKLDLMDALWIQTLIYFINIIIQHKFQVEFILNQTGRSRAILFKKVVLANLWTVESLYIATGIVYIVKM